MASEHLGENQFHWIGQPFDTIGELIRSFAELVKGFSLLSRQETLRQGFPIFRPRTVNGLKSLQVGATGNPIQHGSNGAGLPSAPVNVFLEPT
jgi:hypothetical protein